ncbi:MAG: long-chain-fatty-acid--CoA ligase [Pseudomonadota bacterium]|nr:long-chain-fatty-acid--CoA ligase [Pseudomonadota bacterium]MEC7830563.1 long-chain-fatty-acid--CoA ligase [Pseudomonadota bacterium]MEC9382531.1 long-chain-fatty-acid--CoA ligase [Pseudomonadota bacterium]MEC9481287.1 long-chain-fatty-acid--CoA ligase [Pseudomonadota bacterium]
MRGLMQEWPLLVHTFIDHAKIHHGEREIVTRRIEGDIHTTNYSEIFSRSKKFSKALKGLGVKKGDVIGTLAWNTYRHLESWYGITGLGAIYHTLNPRLFVEQLDYIINHAENKFIITDVSFVEILENIEDKIPNVEGFIFLCAKENLPETKLKNIHSFEELVEAEDDSFEWVKVEEDEACGLCYTSGTTGNPKGVLYSHRSNVLHTLAANSADAMGIKSTDVVMPVVPMFHANAWGLSFSAPMSGCKVVMPGMNMDGESIYELLDTQKVTFTAAVPTVWLMLLQYLEENDLKLPYLERVAIGGSAVPRVMLEKFEKNYDVSVMHAWGMTEMSPLGTIGAFKSGMEDLSFEEQMDIKLKQGRASYMVEMKITNDEGDELPWNGKDFGHLLVRGPFIASKYMKGDGGQILDNQGFFDTGDVATIDELGFMQITDRSKDVIKSGGEWISSIELENIAVGHPEVVEAAVIGIYHPKWDERPLLICVPTEGSDIKKEDILSFLEDKLAKWWMPDDVVFVDEIPHTATGKIQKLTLREQFSDYKLPST